jgi:hypothetical protein
MYKLKIRRFEIWHESTIQIESRGLLTWVRDDAVLKVLENLIAFVDEVNDQQVGNPKRRFDEYSCKFSLSYETKV